MIDAKNQNGQDFEDSVKAMLKRIMPVVPRKTYESPPYSYVGKTVAVEKAHYVSSMKSVAPGADPVTGTKQFSRSTAEFLVHLNGVKYRIEAKSMKSSGSVDEKVQKLIADVKVRNKGYDALLVVTSGMTKRFIATLADAAAKRSDLLLFQSVRELKAFLTL